MLQSVVNSVVNSYPIRSSKLGRAWAHGIGCTDRKNVSPTGPSEKEALAIKFGLDKKVLRIYKTLMVLGNSWY